MLMCDKMLNNFSNKYYITMSFNYNNSSMLPGVYMITTFQGGGLRNSIPLFCSINNFENYFSLTYATGGINDDDDSYIVFPGYKIDLYKTAAATTVDNGTIDNTTGNTLVRGNATVKNDTSKCKIYFNSVEIPNTYLSNSP